MEALSNGLRRLDLGEEAAARGGEASTSGRPASSQVAGLDDALQSLRELIGWPLRYAEEGRQLGVRWLKGVLLHGPPGCGKTLLVRSVAAEFGVRVHAISASGVFAAYTGESEARLRDAFQAAADEAAAGQPVLVFLDEADALCPRRSAGHAHEARVVAQLLTLLDGAAQDRSGRLTVVAATNRPNAIDPALRRAGRLDREIAIPVPGPKARAAILALKTAAMPLGPDVSLPAIAAAAVGYSGADLEAVCREAAMAALEAAAERAQAAGVTAAAAAEVQQQHFLGAMTRVRPSITRGAEVEGPPVRWEDIGGLPEVKQRLRMAVEWPLQHAAAFARLGLTPPRGVLLHGPPGCSKTRLARAAAAASGASFQALACAQLFSAFLGEGEGALRAAFARARAAAPAIVFLDELDALAGSRGGVGAAGEGAGGVGAGARLLSALLTEMDGLEQATGVLVLGATNRPGAIDPALLRPGRFDVHLLVPPPDCEGRREVLRIHTRAMPLAADVDLQALAAQTELFSGAELEGLCREAALAALREGADEARAVAARHFAAALAACRPGLTPELLAGYERWRL